MNLWNLHVKRGTARLYAGQLVAKSGDEAIEKAKKRAKEPGNLGRPFGFAKLEDTDDVSATRCDRK